MGLGTTEILSRRYSSPTVGRRHSRRRSLIQDSDRQRSAVVTERPRSWGNNLVGRALAVGAGLVLTGSIDPRAG